MAETHLMITRRVQADLLIVRALEMRVGDRVFVPVFGRGPE